ncbi:MAG: hypothetical protein IJ196_04125 [Prevotella sp.]|nr:hypothetical protein [Prevotella sp.]
MEYNHNMATEKGNSQTEEKTHHHHSHHHHHQHKHQDDAEVFKNKSLKNKKIKKEIKWTLLTILSIVAALVVCAVVYLYFFV